MKSPENWWIPVTGGFLAGESTFIRTAVSDPDWRMPFYWNGDEDATEIFPHLKVDDELKVFFHHAPGNRRMDFLLQVWEQGVLGTIVIVDSSLPESFRDVRNIIETHRFYFPAPWIVAANKQDLPDAWPIDALRDVLHVPDKIPIVPCIATDRESVKNVLLALLEEVLRDIEAAESTNSG